MRRIVSVLLRSRTIQVDQLVRAPKKGKQESAGPVSNDLINIFKDRQDPEIKQIDEYPVWLLELALPLLTFEQAYPAMATNDPALKPDIHNTRHLMRNSRRQRIFYRNQDRQLRESGDELTFMENFNMENAVDARREELAQQEKQKAIEEEAKQAQESDDDDEDAPKKTTRVVIDREKERLDEEEFKAKLYAKKTK